MKEKKSRLHSKHWISNLILLCCVAIFCVSMWKLIGYLNEYKKGEESYEKLDELVVIPEKEDDEKGKTKGEEKKEYPPVVDAAELMKINSDYAGWIYIDDTVIGYPVVKGKDNDQYLYRTFSGEKNGCGSIFIDRNNEKDFSDRHTVIHGHNMKNGSMFGTLRYFDDKDYWKDHKYIWIITPEKSLKYEIFASYRTTGASEFYDISFRSDEEFEGFLNRCHEKKEYDTGVKTDVEDKILTLSTCTSDTDDGRRLVQARLVYEEEITNEQ